MPLEHRRHGPEVAAREGHLGRKTVLLRVQVSVLGNSPPGLLELCDRKENPTVEICAQLQVRGNEAAIGVLLGKVEDDGRGFVQDEVAIYQHRHSAGRVKLKKVGTAVLPTRQIDAHGIEFYPELLEHPAGPD